MLNVTIAEKLVTSALLARNIWHKLNLVKSSVLPAAPHVTFYEKKESGPRKKNYLRDPKAKAFLSAFTALFSDDTDDENEGATNNDANEDQAEDTHGVSTDNEDIASFLSMVGGSLKE